MQNGFATATAMQTTYPQPLAYGTPTGIKQRSGCGTKHLTSPAFLPFDNENYSPAPFEHIRKKDFGKLVKSLREIDLSAVFEPDETSDLQASSVFRW